jgi:hypothetical protein
LENIIGSGRLAESQYRTAVYSLQDKCAIYAGGCRKRGRGAEAKFYEALAGKYKRTDVRKQKTEYRGL